MEIPATPAMRACACCADASSFIPREEGMKVAGTAPVLFWSWSTAIVPSPFSPPPPSRGRVGVGVSYLSDERTEDRLDGIMQIESDVSVPDAHDLEAFLFEPLGPLSVALFFCALSMLAAIDLDDEPSLEAHEI